MPSTKSAGLISTQLHVVLPRVLNASFAFPIRHLDSKLWAVEKNTRLT